MKHNWRHVNTSLELQCRETMEIRAKTLQAGFEADQLVEIAAKKASQMKQCKSWIRTKHLSKLRGSFEVPRESQACAN